jgi:hypothetical protein
VGEAIGEARAAFMRMLEAHLALLRAELSLAGKELGIIIGLAAAALALVILIGLLLYIGSWLFFGEWLFGSMGWGMIHGSLLNVAIIGFIGVNLAGGSTRSYGWGFVSGLITGVVVAVVLATNALPQGATTVAGEAQESIDLAKNLLATLTGIVIGAAALALVALIVGWRQKLRAKRLAWVIVASALGGAFIGAIVASSLWSYAGAAAIGITIGLLTWIGVGGWLAYRHGFDPEARYATLVPRQSIESLEVSRDFVKAQMKRQKDRMMGR